MRKELITDKEAICIFIIFILGSTLIIGAGGDSKNDSWLAVIFGVLMASPMLFAFCRTAIINQGKDLFEILDCTLGKIIGKIVAIIYILYAFHLGALVLRNYGEFVNTLALPETPMFVQMLCMGVVSIIAVRLGIEVLGRASAFFLPIIFFIIITVQLLAIPQLKLNYLKPILGNGLNPVLAGGFSTFSFPFAEAVLFLGVFSALKTKKSHYKVYYLGMLTASIIITIITIRNICILGNARGNYFFPSYAAVSRINVGDFLQRIEITVSFVFVFGVFVKSSICMLVAAKGISKIFKLNDYRSIVIQVGLLMVYFAYTIYDNSMEMKYWAFKVYPYYAFPMQVILPIIIWVIAEIKHKNKSKRFGG